MSQKKYCLVTFGCQMNDADSEMIDALLQAKSWRKIDSEDEADLMLFNTCVVRQGAEDRAVARLQRLKPIKKANPKKIVGVCGCLAQKDGERLLERLPFLDLVLGTRDLAHLPEMLDAIEAEAGPQVRADVEGDPYDFPVDIHRAAGLIGRVNIIFGCNKGCAYCIVPKTRGRELSRSPEEILDEIRSLAESGSKEILLIGQNVNSYRHDQTRLPHLLRQVNEIDGIERIRFVTSHPRDAGEDLFRAMAELPKVCEGLHLPIQSGSNAVLKRMRRGYRRETYLEKIATLRALVPDIVLTTDIIVGFPGESDEDYEQTLSLVEEVGFDSAFMFMYSPREGTVAAQWEDDVPLDVKKSRLARLIELQESIGAERNRAMIGRKVEVMIERPARRTPGSMSGRTRGDKNAVFPAPADSVGSIVDIEVTSGNAHTLIGKIIKH